MQGSTWNECLWTECIVVWSVCPWPQNWDLTVVSGKSRSRSQFDPTSNGQSTYAKYSSGYCWGIVNDSRDHPWPEVIYSLIGKQNPGINNSNHSGFIKRRWYLREEQNWGKNSWTKVPRCESIGSNADLSCHCPHHLHSSDLSSPCVFSQGVSPWNISHVHPSSPCRSSSHCPLPGGPFPPVHLDESSSSFMSCLNFLISIAVHHLTHSIRVSWPYICHPKR